jgi:hypothetical protein
LKVYGLASSKIEADRMNPSLKLFGLAAAVCAACCAVSLFPAAIAGLSLASVGVAATQWGAALFLITIPVAALYLLSQRKNPGASKALLFSAMEGQNGCGCGTACSTTTDETEGASIACTLTPGDFKERTGWINDLARRTLRHATRTPLSLTLTYAPDAVDDVHELMRMEQSCCAFLDFQLQSDPNGVTLTITAHKSAAVAANDLFDHFAPHLASHSIQEAVQ